MKKVILAISVVFGLAVSITLVLIFQEEKSTEVHNEELSKSFLDKNIPIIDIRTKDDWETTAVVKDSVLFTFYKKDGRYDKQFFLRNLNTIVDKNSEFAVLSRTGKKSQKVAKILKAEGYENVINLKGGVRQGIKNHIKFVKYYN